MPLLRDTISSGIGGKINDLDDLAIQGLQLKYTFLSIRRTLVIIFSSASIGYVAQPYLSDKILECTQPSRKLKRGICATQQNQPMRFYFRSLLHVLYIYLVFVCINHFLVCLIISARIYVYIITIILQRLLSRVDE